MGDRNRSGMGYWRDSLIMAAVAGGFAWLALNFARGPGELAAVWFSNGIVAGWLLSRPSPRWSLYLIAAVVAEIAARLATGDAPVFAVALALCNATEVLAVAMVIRWRIPDIDDPERWLTLGGVATAGTLLACALSGAMAAANLLLLGSDTFASAFITWYAAHVLGMVVIGTSSLVLHREGRRLFFAPGRGLAFVLTMLLIAVVAAGVFSLPYPVLFLAYPPLLMGAFRFRFAGVAVGVLVLAAVGSVATALGYGAIVQVQETGTGGHIVLFQLFIAAACLLTIPVALAMAERKRLDARLRQSEHRYRMLADYSHDVIVRMRANGERVYVSPSAQDILGWSPEEMLGPRWDLLHPEDVARQQDAMCNAMISGRAHTATYRIRHKNGHYVWIEAVTRPIPATDGEGMDLIFTGRDISRRVAAEQALEASHQELERLVRVDPLTGVANRRQLDERVALALSRLERHGTPLAVMYLDIDHFKHVNDTWGHAAGDQVLCSLAQRLRACVRAGDLVARMGGDEFVVVIEDGALPDAAEKIARKLLTEVYHPIDLDDVTLMATVSIGIGYALKPTEATSLLAAADEALYAAKQAGRNTYRMQSAPDLRFDRELIDL